ncbi:MAG: ribosomal-processing cysteine protease Prp [Ruminococcus sp.]|nr:ribosomal-processing cysteine protease Prp [Ruminococcus sp.]
MIRADFYRDRDSRLLGLHISGHAGLAEEGEDVVCAAVSSAVMMTCNTITEVYKINAKVNVEDNDILLKLVSDDKGDGDRLLLGLMLQLDLISQDYPGTLKIGVNDR